MRRRTVLHTVGGALSGVLTGCTSGTGRNASPTPSPTASTTPTPQSTNKPKGELQRTVTLEDQDSVPKPYRVSIDVDVLESAITTAHTARLRVTMTNEGPPRAFRVAGGNCRLFTESHAGSDKPAGIWLYQPNETKYLDRKGERWVPDRPPSHPRSYPASACAPREYKSDESVSTEYEVWDDYQLDGYLKPDTYRWEGEVEIWEETEPRPRGTDSPAATFTWGFSLAVENAE